MGERLVINFQRNGKTVLNTYQHWNGYTRGALVTIINCLDFIKKDNSANDNVKLAHSVMDAFNSEEMGIIDTLISSMNPENYRGAGLDGDDYDKKEIRDLYNMPATGSRNTGIICVTPETIEGTSSWGEEFANINLEDLTVNIKDLFWKVDDETLEDRKDMDMNPRDVVCLPKFIKNIDNNFYSRDQLMELLEFLGKALKDGYPDFKDEEGNMYSVIE